MPGVLYIVATPIGNLEDITLRALRILREAGRIACEDTRQTRKLLEHYAISKPLTSYHQHNETAAAAQLLECLRAGESVALVSDAGTPLISDPGFRIVTAARREGIPVVPVPGPSAALAALSAAGLASDAFHFAGFLPPKRAQRRKLFEMLSAEEATLVFYEAPHRILECLEDAAEILGGRPMVLAREVTKIHEEFLSGDARTLREILAARPAVKGEITLLVARNQGPPPDDGTPLAEAVEREMRAGLGRMDAIKAVAKRRGLPKRTVYDAVRE